MKKNLESRTSEFIEKAIKVHGDKYDYSKVEYEGSHTKVWIKCPEHGNFEQSPTNHLSGNGCHNCAAKYSRGKYRLTTLDTFLKQAKGIHHEKYDYSKVEWKNTYTKITIICPVHGEFKQMPQNHIRLKCGCRKCGRIITKSKLSKYNTNYFVENAIKVHGDKYSYTNSECFNATDKVMIECPTHGKFPQPANQHLQGHGCPQCNFDQMAKDRSMGKENFIARSKELFGEKFDYSKVEYVNGQTNVILICKTHKEFKVRPNAHLTKKSSCPICNESKLEREVTFILDKPKIKYERQKKFKWLGKQSLDFYLQDYSIAIECQGIQHFKPVDFAGKGEKWATNLLEDVKKRDDIKLNKCLNQNIKMIYVVDNKEYFNKKYHLNITEPFSGNVSYHIIHINDLDYYVKRLIYISNLFG
jgi:hypothetical protein